MGYDWQMPFNVGKCVAMYIGANNNLYTYNMNNTTLKTVDVDRDFGVIMKKNGKCSEQCLMVARKSNSVQWMIKRNIKSKYSDIIMMLYKSLVLTRLEYYVQVFSPYFKKDIEDLERVQKRAIQIVYGRLEVNYKDRVSL